MPDNPDQYVPLRLVGDGLEALANYGAGTGTREAYREAARKIHDAARSVPILPPGHIAISTEDAGALANTPVILNAQAANITGADVLAWGRAQVNLRAALAAAKEET